MKKVWMSLLALCTWTLGCLPLLVGSSGRKLGREGCGSDCRSHHVARWFEHEHLPLQHWWW